jgi:hypothetical protein
LIGFEQHEQAGVVRVGGVVDERVEQVGGRDRRAVLEVGGAASIERDGVRAVLQQPVGEYPINAVRGAAPECEIAVGVR